MVAAAQGMLISADMDLMSFLRLKTPKSVFLGPIPGTSHSEGRFLSALVPTWTEVTYRSGRVSEAPLSHHHHPGARFFGEIDGKAE